MRKMRRRMLKTEIGSAAFLLPAFHFRLNHLQHLTGLDAKGLGKLKKRIYRGTLLPSFQLDKIDAFQKRLLRHLPFAQVFRFPEFAQGNGNGVFQARIILHSFR